MNSQRLLCSQKADVELKLSGIQLLFKVGFDMICDKGMTVAKKFGAKTSSGEPARKKLLKFGNNHSIYNISTYIFNIFIE